MTDRITFTILYFLNKEILHQIMIKDFFAKINKYGDVIL